MTEQTFFFWDWMQHWFVAPLTLAAGIGLCLGWLLLRSPADFWVLIASAVCLFSAAAIDVCRAVDACWYYDTPYDFARVAVGIMAVWTAVEAWRRRKRANTEPKPDEP
jgi:hypothetical protein